MKVKVAVLALAVILSLAACGPGPSSATYYQASNPQLQPPVTTDYAAQATTTARQSQDAAATYDASISRATATAYAATRVAEVATAEAAAIATGTAQAYASAATSTTDALDVRATEQAMVAGATREAGASAATATAAAGIAAFEATLAADEASRLHLLRQAEAAQVRRMETWNALWPYLLVVVVVVVGLVLALVVANWWRKQEPIRQVASGEHRYILVYNNGSGDYRVLSQPPPSPSHPLALPAPAEDSGVPQLPRFTQGHVLVAGETGSGKTNALRAILQHRQNVVVLDPHDEPDKWQHETIGGGRNFEAIAAYMESMAGQLNRRYQLQNRGEGDFESLTVAVDEMPAIIAAVGGDIADVWRQWLREGRKVGLFFAAATQSTRVRTLGIEGEADLLENFTCVLALGKLAASRHPELVRDGDPYPAVLETLGGARAVRVPYLGEANGNGNGHKSRQPQVVAPAIEPIETKHGVVTPTQIADILRMRRAGWSSAKIETAVFDQESPGGAAYYKVKEVLERYKNGVGVATVE